MLPPEDSDRAFALVDEAIAVATRVGEPMGAANATMTKGNLAVRRARVGCRAGAYVDGLELNVQLGDVASAQGGFFMSSVVLCALGALEPAAVALGKAECGRSRRLRSGRWRWWRRPTPPWPSSSVRRALAELAAHGAALEFRDAVAYLRAEADRVLPPE